MDETANVLKTYQYDAFGNEQNAEPLDTNPFRYCGEYFDRETGTYYLRARNYDPATGRFTTEDAVRSATYELPNKKQMEDPLSLNLYTYAHNNPILFTDPTGYFSFGQILGGSMAMYMGYAAMTAGLAAITVLTGGLALAIAAGAVVAGGGLMAYGAYEATEGVTGYNSLKNLQGADAYYGTMAGLSIAAPAAGMYSAQAYQMYKPIRPEEISYSPIAAPTNQQALKNAMGKAPFANAQVHHGLPWKFKDWFATKGLNVNNPQFGVWVPGGGNGGHQSWSYAYNQAWDKWIRTNPNATAGQIQKYYSIIRNNTKWNGGF